jgi:hypothetical protein
MIKKQQMRWNRWTLQPFLDVRVAVLNKSLAGSFKRLYPDFQTDNDNHAALVATSAGVAARSFIRALSTCLESSRNKFSIFRTSDATPTPYSLLLLCPSRSRACAPTPGCRRSLLRKPLLRTRDGSSSVALRRVRGASRLAQRDPSHMPLQGGTGPGADTSQLLFNCSECTFHHWVGSRNGPSAYLLLDDQPELVQSKSWCNQPEIFMKRYLGVVAAAALAGRWRLRRMPWPLDIVVD